MIMSALALGLVWFPFVLAVGLTYRHLKIVDISIDGVAIVAGVAAALAWQATGGYALSIALAGAVGVCGGIAMGILVFALRIEALLAGVLVSLSFQALSVVVIGESITLAGTRLAGSATSMLPGLLVYVAVLAVLASAFYRTHFGLLTRALGSNAGFHTTLPRGVVVTSGLAFSGLMIGIGSGVYVHVEGVARSGGGFDFLLTGLTSFLVVERLGRSLHDAVTRRSRDGRAPIRLGRLLSAATAVPVLALIGASVFQVLVVLVLRWSPRPDLWKLLLSILLVLALGRPQLAALRRRPAAARSPDQAGLPSLGRRLLEINGLEKSVVDAKIARVLLRGVSLGADRGLVSLSGDNGTGKTTLLRCISGETAIERGTVTVSGLSVEALPPHRRGVFRLYQDPHSNLASDLTAYENLLCAAWPSLRPLSFASRHTAERLLLRVPSYEGFLTDRPATTDILGGLSGGLSAGEAQGISVLMGLLSGMPVLLADEPTASLDSVNRRKVARMLHEAGRVRVILAVTHDAELIDLSERRLQLRDGLIQEQETQAEAENVAASTLSEES